MGIQSLLPLLVLLVGAYLLVKLGAFYIFHPKRTLSELLFPLRERESRRALSLALAGTLGVGNIFGVATGIMLGGAGALFWLFFSSFFSAVIKYAEVLLAFDNLDGERSGMPAVFRRVFSRFGRVFAPLYLILCLFLSVFMGGAMQTSAVVGVGRASMSQAWPLIPLVFALAVFLSTVNGVGKIEKITAAVIPVTTVVYVLLSFSVISLRTPELCGVIGEILSSAFCPSALGGGVVAFLFSPAISEGFARGVLSNEAGVGTSAFAHVRAKNRTPHEAGLFGMCEVFFDTTLLCTLTGLVILLGTENPTLYDSPMALVVDSFSSVLGGWVGAPLLVLVFLFAYSTVISWYYYGGECAEALFGRRSVFFPFFFAALVFGGSIGDSFLIYITDLLIFLMSLLTLSAILKERERIKALSQGK